jgi:hypothetical protein
MKLITRARPHKYMKRLIKRSIRETERRHRLKQIAGMAPAPGPHIKGMKKKVIYRLKHPEVV